MADLCDNIGLVVGCLPSGSIYICPFVTHVQVSLASPCGYKCHNYSMGELCKLLVYIDSGTRKSRVVLRLTSSCAFWCLKQLSPQTECQSCISSDTNIA